MIQKNKKYDVGDIVFVSKYNYQNKTNGQNHLFVIISDDNLLVTAEYFGMIVSSHIEKSKDVSRFKYNETLDKNIKNGLNVNSIVKCDEIFNIPNKNIQFKIGTVDIDDYIRFIESYNKYLSELTSNKQTN